MGARLLTFEQAIEWRREKVWIEFREMPGTVLPAVYNLEHAPFVRFRIEGMELQLNCEVRRDYYGKTWRCFAADPEGTAVPIWGPLPGWSE